MIKDIQAIIFDLDGTLADSMWVWEDIDKEFFKSRQIPIPDDLQVDIEGMSFTETAEYFINRFHLPETLDELIQLWNHMALKRYAENILLKEGGKEFLDYAKASHIKMGIATSNSRLLLDVFLHKNGLKEYFGALTTSDEVKKGKPSPDVYLRTARKLSVKPNRCLIVEDIPNGILAGKNAGMITCAIQDDYSADLRKEKEALADYFVEDFNALMQLIGA